MIRSLALTASFCLSVSAPALAQTHPPTHAQGHPHDATGHGHIDPGHHAAMHALLGSWTGTSNVPREVSRKLGLDVATDKLGNVTLEMKADRPIGVGAASSIAVDGNTLHWTQDVSGAACKATAVLSAATPLVPEKLKGSMACEHGEITFALQKTKE
jgi:hypothetical protein